jgi:hypothetical protein
METDSGLTLEPMAPTHEAPDPEVSFADVGLTSPALATSSPESRRTEESSVPSMIPNPPPKKAWDFEPVKSTKRVALRGEPQLRRGGLNRSSQREGSRALFRWCSGAAAPWPVWRFSPCRSGWPWRIANRRTSTDARSSSAVPGRGQREGGEQCARRTRRPSTPVCPRLCASTVDGPDPNPLRLRRLSRSRKHSQARGRPSRARPVQGQATTPKSSATVGTGSKAIPKAVVSTPGSQTASADSHGTDPLRPQTAPSPAPCGGPPTREEGFEPVTDGPADTKATWSQSDFTPAPTQTQRKPAVSTRPRSCSSRRRSRLVRDTAGRDGHERPGRAAPSRDGKLMKSATWKRWWKISVLEVVSGRARRRP